LIIQIDKYTTKKKTMLPQACAFDRPEGDAQTSGAFRATPFLFGAVGI